jgi:hypothetical protein
MHNRRPAQARLWPNRERSGIVPPMIMMMLPVLSKSSMTAIRYRIVDGRSPLVRA